MALTAGPNTPRGEQLELFPSTARENIAARAEKLPSARFAARSRRRPLFRRSLRGVPVLFALLSVAVATALYWSLYDLSISNILIRRPVPVVQLEAADGSALIPRGPTRGAPVMFAELPQHLVDAVLAIEDQRFFSHRGIDLHGVGRALLRNLSAGRTVEGGSTITQQLVKVLSGETDRTLKRKLREAVSAFLLEQHLTKDEILVRYLENVYLGAGVTGIEAAARLYFDKPVTDLTLAESALLAGLIRAPSELNPLRNLAEAHERAALVLNAMVESGRLDEATAKVAMSHPAVTNPAWQPASTGSWFADWAYQEAMRVARVSTVPYGAALRVRTTLSPELQALAERVVKEALDRHGRTSGVSQAALVVMRPNGEVVAMVGGRDYQKNQFNRAVHAARQPGSTFKLFVYLAALLNGYSLYDGISDEPFRIGRWKPRNYDGRYHGVITLSEAFARSLNVATARLAQEVGIDEVIAAARLLGIEAPLPKTPSLALGSAEVSLLELTAAYAAVRAGVTPVRPTAIAALESLDPSEPVVPSVAPVPQQELGRLRQPLITLLENVVAWGTGRAAAVGGFTAGKTGTTEHYRDAWFVGFTDDLVAGVWVGNDDNRPMERVTGGKIPAAIWREFMAAASEPKQAPAEEVVMADSDGPCDLSACAARYRSFRSSDCSFQPYVGARRICRLGAPHETQVAITGGELPGGRAGHETALIEEPAGPDMALIAEPVEPGVVYEDEILVEEDRDAPAMESVDEAHEDHAADYEEVTGELDDGEFFPEPSSAVIEEDSAMFDRECRTSTAAGSKARERPGSSAGCRG
jgi:1A family penicillin-binding protein